MCLHIGGLALSKSTTIENAVVRLTDLNLNCKTDLKFFNLEVLNWFVI